LSFTSLFKKNIKAGIIKANIHMDEKVRDKVEKYHGVFCESIRENIDVSLSEGLPLCQDTGMIEFFVLKGNKVCLDISLEEILNECVREVYTENPFRYSVVEDPLFKRVNTKNNTPVIIHYMETEGNKLEVRFLIKGGGSENLSFLKMMSPSSTEEDIIETVVSHIREKGAKSCPPLHIGIGIGGTSDKAIMLAKYALTENIDYVNPINEYASLEKKITDRVNGLKIGFQGLGKGISAYSTTVKSFPTHIATLPLAIAVDCYVCRKGSVEFEL